MRKPFMFTSLILGVLLLAPPTFAIPYSLSGSLDLTTLTFSGISPSSSGWLNPPVQQRQEAKIGEPDNVIYFNAFTTNTLTNTLPGIATAVSTADPNQLYTSFSLFGVGGGSANTFLHTPFIAESSGYATASIQYAFLQSGTVDTALNDTHANAWIGFHSGQPFTQDLALFDTTQSSQNGTLSISQWFNAGDLVTLQMSTTSSAVTVSEADMFWLTALGFLGLAGWYRYKRRTA